MHKYQNRNARNVRKQSSMTLTNDHNALVTESKNHEMELLDKEVK
jgi:hypothetical protein